jgi:hypothetical protein
MGFFFLRAVYGFDKLRKQSSTKISAAFGRAYL